MGRGPTERRGAAAPAVGAVRGHQAAVPGGTLGPGRTRWADDEAAHVRTYGEEAALVGARSGGEREVGLGGVSSRASTPLSRM